MTFANASAQGEHRPLKARPDTSASGKNPGAGTKGKVLIADDSASLRRVIALRVRQEGYEPITVEDGQAALDYLWQHGAAIDVVLLDMQMPRLTGVEVLGRINAEPALAHIPVLMISGGEDIDTIVRCIEVGAVDYLPKPFNQAILRARLTACLARKRQRDREIQTMTRAGIPWWKIS
jgi:DNA-binding response OmpR family regulator